MSGIGPAARDRQFELEMRYSFHSPGGTLALAMHRCAVFSIAVGLFALLGANWLIRTPTGSRAPGSFTDPDIYWTAIQLFQHDKHGLSSCALVAYLVCLAVAVARPAQRTSSRVAAVVGVLATVLLLSVTPQDRTDDLASYHESWLPTTILPVILWIVLIGITFNARRVSPN
jgi:hypothetical protein